MPVAYRFEEDIITIEATGTYTPDDLKATVQQVLDDAAAPQKKMVLFDLTTSTSLPNRSTEQVRDMAGFLQSLRERLGPRIAMVTSGKLAYGLMRMGSSYADNAQFAAEAFTDTESAKAWLRAQD